jgi:thiol-disulfide isomerase/thioredoxin
MRGALRPTPMLRTAILALVMLAAPAYADTLKVGDRVTELDVAVDAKGKPFKLKAYKGKWLVITIGAKWCKPCAKELPTWDKLAPSYAGKVTFIAVDIDDDIAEGKMFHDKLKIKNMTRVYLPNEKSSVGGNYGSDTMPTTFVADPQGVVRWVKKGFEEGDASGESKKLSDQLTKLTRK